MKPKTITTPDLILTSPKHKEALLSGPDWCKLSSELNVIDSFKSLSQDQIRQRLKETSFPYAVCLENLIGDFTVSTAVRNANAFNAREVFYVGRKKIDRRGFMGVHNYTPVQWLSTIDELKNLKKKYTFIGIDNIPGSKPLSGHIWKPNTMICFGEEGCGLSVEMQKLCEKIISIPMYGSVRSINCGVASGIIMHSLVSQFRGHCG